MNSKARLKRVAKMLLLCLIWGIACAAQTSTKDVSFVIASGKFSGNQYQNDYLGLTFTADGGHVKPGTVTNLAGKRARIAEALCDCSEPDSSYSFSISVDSLENYPTVKTPAQYLRSVRHSLEKEGLRTLREESSVEISGVPFTSALMEVPGKEIPYFRGIYSTFRKGYVLNLDLTARKENVIGRLASTLIQFKEKTK